MYVVRPITDLRNKASEISNLVHEEQKPVLITKQGLGDMVVMSVEQFTFLTGERRIDESLRVAEAEALAGAPRRDFRKVAKEKRDRVSGAAEENSGV